MNKSHRKQMVREADFGKFLRRQLDEQSTPLPPHVREGLRKARTEALAERRKKSLQMPVFWKPVASFASVIAVIAALLYFNGFAPGDQFLFADNGTDAELLFGDEGFQFYEDLEFYRWLANNDL